MDLRPYLKAVVGFVAPGAVVIGSAVTDASDAGSHISGAEWVTAIVACVLTSAAVFRTPNLDPHGLRQDESVQPPACEHEWVERGSGPDDRWRECWLCGAVEDL